MILSASQFGIRVGAAGVLAAAAMLVGCGDEGTTDAPVTVPVGAEPAQRLTKAEAVVIRRTEQSVSSYCRGVAAAVARGMAPSAEDFATVNASIDELTALATEKPNAETASGDSAVGALGEIAENLEGTNCDSRLVARIDADLAAIP